MHSYPEALTHNILISTSDPLSLIAPLSPTNSPEKNTGDVPFTTRIAGFPLSTTVATSRSIRFRTSLRNTVCDVMRDRGWKETESETEWEFFWCDIHWLHESYDGLYLREDQRINHFKNHYELTRKDLLVKNMKRMIKDVAKRHGRNVADRYDRIATSFVLPQEHALFQEAFKKNPGTVWIMKPVGKAQGRGIFLINKISQVNGWRKDPRLMARGDNGEPVEGPEAYIIQKYIDRPYLIGGKKFDIRAYALVTCWNPLTIYMHRHAFCRFSNTPFSMDAKDISNLCALTQV
jgi:tubulin polyglutamylase TTLL9